MAVVTGFDADFDIQHNFQNPSPTAGHGFVWTVDVNTGSVLTQGIPTSEPIGPITYSLDGTTLYGATLSTGQIVTLNPATGASSLVGSPGLSNFITGLAFRPSDGTLFAIDGGTDDTTVILNPNTGSVVTKLGSIVFGGAHGLAFSAAVPEPTTATLLLLGMLGCGWRRRLAG